MKSYVHQNEQTSSSEMIDFLEKLGLVDGSVLRSNFDDLKRQQDALLKSTVSEHSSGPTVKIEADIRRLKKDNDSLAAHTEMLACAVGACPLCWGLDIDCTKCAGEGKSGFFLPDEICFEQFVLPVINRILRQSKTPAQNNNGAQPTIISGEKNDRI